MVRYGELRARQLGDYTIAASRSPRYNQFQRVFGWKLTLHAQALAKRLGLQGTPGSAS